MARGVEQASACEWPWEQTGFFSDLDRSLGDIEPDAEGVRMVLLCRVALGEVRTSDPIDAEVVTETMMNMTENSLMIRGEDKHFQAFARTEDQVYVEYMLELVDPERCASIDNAESSVAGSAKEEE